MFTTLKLIEVPAPPLPNPLQMRSYAYSEKLSTAVQIQAYPIVGIYVWARLIGPVGADENVPRCHVASVVHGDIQDGRHQVRSLPSVKTYSYSSESQIEKKQPTDMKICSGLVTLLILVVTRSQGP